MQKVYSYNPNYFWFPDLDDYNVCNFYGRTLTEDFPLTDSNCKTLTEDFSFADSKVRTLTKEFPFADSKEALELQPDHHHLEHVRNGKQRLQIRFEVKTDAKMTVQKDLEKKIQSFTINIYKGFKVEINKIFIPVKIALFCWFAGKVITTMVGGIVMSALGGRTAYTVMGSVVSVYGIIYGIYVLVLHLRRSRKFTPGAEEPKEDVH
ncbi:hypothetical protein HNY73_018828 [Argiope bruennichi]|uniref:Uncharacterized protein n=1 Tax=Argiope bruennichi TaxID=94029 RepID=A0A8T0EFK3_ARGBR|nr:hypothetical protein HNY73_018828 [Argiope bruennichi]